MNLFAFLKDTHIARNCAHLVNKFYDMRANSCFMRVCVVFRVSHPTKLIVQRNHQQNPNIIAVLFVNSQANKYKHIQ